jgi:hypothetical protein
MLIKIENYILKNEKIFIEDNNKYDFIVSNNNNYYNINNYLNTFKNISRTIERFSIIYDVHYIVEKIKKKKYFFNKKCLIIFFHQNFNILNNETKNLILNNCNLIKNENNIKITIEDEEKDKYFENLKIKKKIIGDILDLNFLTEKSEDNIKMINFEKKLKMENMEIKSLPVNTFKSIDIKEKFNENFLCVNNNKFRENDFRNYKSKKSEKMKNYFTNLILFSFLNGINFFQALEFLFITNKSLFLFYLYKFCSVHLNSNLCFMIIKNHFSIPTLSKVLLLKNRININDEDYEYLRSFLKLEFFLPTLSNLVSFRRKIDNFILKEFKIKFLNFGVICSPKILLKNIIIAFNYYIKKFNENLNKKNGYSILNCLDKNNIIFKYSIDGSYNFIYGGYQMINNEIFDNKSCKGWFLNSIQEGINFYLFFY